MLMRIDPARGLTPQAGGTVARPGTLPMDAWREDDRFVVEFDAPGVPAESLHVEVERDVLTVRAERPARPNRDLTAAERPYGVFTRQLLLDDTLDSDRIQADYTDGVLRITIPVAARAKPRRIDVTSAVEEPAPVTA
ncbi:Hsp20 family protein [Mycobacterium sp. MYCO198283]|uniref:Hsp20/alpha crystallin family protein n=1 Tax=Mycobacterium sp. MYCO198283 TaxID=2883505 RepID=UPI001E5C0953|nr:Hsp20 family protein [Mycobacterium sp. MYCO198283]MCG5432388.1 Hsp20 family protein [Mycobacterium sp. MYCO198283]